MVSLNESMASRLFQWARDLDVVQQRGSWKSQPHEVKENFRALANRLHNYLGAVGYPEGDFIVVPEGEYKVRPYTRPYPVPGDQPDAGEGGIEDPPEGPSAGDQGTAPAEPEHHPV